MPDSATSSSFVAVLRLTAATTIWDATANASATSKRIMNAPSWWRFRGGVARSQIEDAGALRVIAEIEVRGDDVVDMDEVAALLAIGIAARALEKPHAPVAQVFIREVERDGRHPALVRLTGPVHVEVA